LHAANALFFGLVALTASLLHLGRPWLAYRAILGLRHSWLSREIVAFGAFAGLATAYAGAVLLSGRIAPEIANRWRVADVIDVLGWAVAASGVVAVFCSAMIYVFTQRECWSPLRVGMRFGLTAALLGVAAMWLSILLSAATSPSSLTAAVVQECGAPLCRTLLAIAAVKLLWEASIFRHLLSPRMTAMRRSAMLMSGELSTTTIARFALGVLGGVLMPALLASQLSSEVVASGIVQFTATTVLLFVACVGGELMERYLFFTACAAPRMPGGLR
jgi:DMSO reductase anchor subunit